VRNDQPIEVDLELRFTKTGRLRVTERGATVGHGPKSQDRR